MSDGNGTPITRTRRSYDAPLNEWFASRGWKVAPFQREVWRRYRNGESGLVVTPTGSGKTLAVFGGPLLEAMAEGVTAPAKQKRGQPTQGRVRVLWITPLRALANDTARALREPIEALGLPWTVAMRTGDASARDKRLARQGKTDVLVITPESLALLLSYPDTRAQLAGLRSIVVDEWHELLGNKRGVLLQLCLARLRAWSPQTRTWGLSATLGNLAQARDVLLPHAHEAAIVSNAKQRSVTLETLLPEPGERFPWAGHLGLSQLQRVFERVQSAETTLLFANTRAQAELWHRALQAVWFDAPDALALHHGSLDPKLRQTVEQGLRERRIRCVVATSSLDLGVDFPAVDQVIQLGSPKGVSRLLQRSGRARHRPGEAGHVLCVPTHALELAEYAAARQALHAGEVEARTPLIGCLDVLAQHCITLALAGGFSPDELLPEIRSTHAYAALSDEDWQAVLRFIVQGGEALQHYPDYRRVVIDDESRYRVEDRRIAMRHRMSIGTIASDGMMQVKMLRGGSLGSVEEAFVSRLRPGDHFHFAGRLLELVRLHEMVAQVRPAKRGDGIVPRWQGGRLPLSTQLGRRVEAVLSNHSRVPEAPVLAPLMVLQSRISDVPQPGRLLVEQVKTREGWHVFVYPFAGRSVHEGLAALFALRLSRESPNTFGFAVNDYGFALTASAQLSVSEEDIPALLDSTNVIADIADGVNMSELARRQFREVARVAGLLPPSLPGKAPRSLRQLQVSSGLLYDVLRQHDPDHLLLRQAEREVLEIQLELPKLEATLAELRTRQVLMQHPKSLTPLSFPLWAEMRRGTLSNEDWKTRVQRAAEKLEARFDRIR